ncbi:MAG: alpha/beta family hydrolase [Acidimicrobiia bacterium]
MQFNDRYDAGIRLARACEHLAGEHPIVLGLVRGGLPVAFEVANHLHAPLDALGVRKIGLPRQPELALGAVGEDDALVVDPELQAWAGITDASVERFVDEARAALTARMAAIRAEIPMLPVTGRTVIVVDDGIATGATMQAALECLRSRDVTRLILAVPVAAAPSLARLSELVDEVVCLHAPDAFGAVSVFYDQFPVTTDLEVIRLLRHQRAVQPGVRPAAVLVDATASSPRPSSGSRIVGVAPGVEVEIEIPIEGPLRMPAVLHVPDHPRALVVFAHGAGSNRHSPRNTAVASVFATHRYASLRLDLLTPEETAEHVKGFAFPLLAARLRAALRWARAEPALAGLPEVLYGASTGAAVACIAAAAEPTIAGIISRGGRADLVRDVLPEVRVPCLFLVGERDDVVADLTRSVVHTLGPRAQLRIIPGAGHLFEEPGALTAVAEAACEWLDQRFAASRIR